MSVTGGRPIPRPLHLVSNSNCVPGVSTPLSASTLGPLSAPLNPGRNINEFDAVTTRPKPRRQGSISYNIAATRGRAPALGRSNSLGSNAIMGAVKEVVRGAENRSPRLPAQNGVRESEAVTLAEKHADLLHFIAQKESKCLELRTQLAQHEADLLLLKRKWERIVSKGSPLSGRPDVAPTVGSDMLDGIREGVQSSLGKVFAVLDPGPSVASPLQPHAMQGRRIQHLERDAVASSRKRVSISTTSSSSTRGHSSLSGSGSSASSLFDDLSSIDPQSSASSVGDSTACPSPDIDKTSAVLRPSKAFKRSSWSSSQLPLDEADVEPSHADDDPSSKRRKSRPSSMNLSQVSSPPAMSPSPGGVMPLSKQVSTWVPGLNKKWEELKGSETLSKQSKRASVLLSDVLAVLAPPAPPASHMGAGTHSPLLAPSPSPSHTTLDSTFLDPVTGGGGGRGAASMCTSPSLLDEEDGFGLGVGDVLQPQITAGIPAASDGNQDSHRDEWNW